LIQRPNVAGGTTESLQVDTPAALEAVFGRRARAQLMFGSGALDSLIERRYPRLEPLTDYSFFPLPSIEDEYGVPVVGGGDFLAVLTDREATELTLRWLVSVEGSTLWASGGSIIAPNQHINFDIYAGMRVFEAQQIAVADQFVFKGSDLAQPAVREALLVALRGFVSDPTTLLNQQAYLASFDFNP
jgi:alpha-glucoside transport system substrate-binding protein